MNKSRFFTKPNHKGKLIFGFMAVTIISPVILAACGSPTTNNSNHQNSSNPEPFNSELFGEKQGLKVASQLLEYKKDNKDAVFKNISEMENFYYTGNVEKRKSTWSPDIPAKKSIFKHSVYGGYNYLYYYVVPGNPVDKNYKQFYEGKTKVMQKLYDITYGLFRPVQVWEGSPKDVNYDDLVANWWSPKQRGEIIDLQEKRMKKDFETYKILGRFPYLKILLAPSVEIAQDLIWAYRRHASDNELPIIGWGSF